MPYKLLERIILMYSNENDTVLDLYLGTGVTAEVALKTNRNFKGCDICEESIQISNERIKII